MTFNFSVAFYNFVLANLLKKNSILHIKCSFVSPVTTVAWFCLGNYANQPTNEPTNISDQPTNISDQPTNQPTNQPSNRPTKSRI